jgi:uracil-DNA glycosylase family 4
MNRAIERRVRVPDCELCPLHEEALDVCVTADGPGDAEIAVVTKNPVTENGKRFVSGQLRAAGIDPKQVLWTSAVKCRNYERESRPSDVRACAPYLQQELALVKPEWVITFGNEPLLATTKRSGIQKHRGKIQEVNGHKVFPTISPAAVLRRPGDAQGFEADLSFISRRIDGKPQTLHPPKAMFVDNDEKLLALRGALRGSVLSSYDVETTISERDEYAESAAIISLSFTLLDKAGNLSYWGLPLFHPESPYQDEWQNILNFLKEDIYHVKKQVAHNGKFDARWLRRFNVRARCTFDTILAAALLDENRSKSLKNLARTELGVENWGIDTKTLLDQPIRKVLKYNILDTFYTYHLYELFRKQLLQQPRLLRIFQLVMMPALEVLIESERGGIYVDRERLTTRARQVEQELERVENKLLKWVPEDYDGSINFNPVTKFMQWWVWDYLGLPVVKTTKKGKKPSLDEEAMLLLRKEHEVIPLLLERSGWYKLHTSFFTPYQELLDERSRIHTTFKLHGTVTGRLSSGKEDADKISGRRPKRGVNLQQVPRDKLVRGLFGAEPGYVFVEADFSQIELRVVAFISREPTMIRLFQLDQDIHRMTAIDVLHRDPKDSEERKKAKAINFGFAYGMGAPKFQHTAYMKYGLELDIRECKAYRRAYFQKYAGLPEWHNRQRRLVHKYGRVVSPIGRIRHLPDIESRDEMVRHEAERQAINSPVQSFASDMTTLAMVLLDQQFREQLMDVRILGTVHDAILFEIREEHVAQVLPKIKQTMENLPLEKKFGVYLDVPIKVDVKAGTHWGDARELTEEEVFDWHRSDARMRA